MPKFKLNTYNLCIFITIALVAIATVLFAWYSRHQVPIMQKLEGQISDIQHQWRGYLQPQTTDDKSMPIALLMIDDKTIRSIGSLPIDRKYLAQAVDILRQQQTKLIVFDMIFSEAARGNPLTDKIFAESIAKSGNVILSYELGVDSDKSNIYQVPDYLLDFTINKYSNDKMAERIALSPNRILHPIPSLAASATGFGHVSALPGPDGALRYDYPILKFQDEFFPSVALVAANLARGGNSSDLAVRFADYIKFADKTFPIDFYSRLIVQYYGATQTFPTYSLVDLLEGKLAKDIFKGKMVIIGGFAVGANDRNPSPFDASLPGSERLATVIDNLQSDRWLERPTWAGLSEIILIILLPFIAITIVIRYRPLLTFFILTALLISILLIYQYLFVSRNWIFTPLYPIFSLTIAATLAIFYRGLLDEISRRRAETDLRASEQRYALAARGANDGLWDWDIESGQVFFSERWHQLMCIENKSMHTMEDWYNCLETAEAERLRQQVDSHLNGQSNKLYHVTAYKSQGQERWVLVRGVVLKNGQPTRMAGSITDITEQKGLQKQIQLDALNDRLTGLSNYYPFHEKLRSMFKQTQVLYGHAAVGLVVIDVNHFRQLNEKYSQLIGNEILREISARLTNEFKDQHLARTGGDQFMLAYLGELSLEYAQRCFALFNQEFTLNGKSEKIEVTIATGHSSQNIATADDLFNALSLTLAIAKQNNKKSLAEYDPTHREVERDRQWLRDNIDLALAAGDQFQVFYQPFIRLSDRKLLGFESLIRWVHPEKGFIYPDAFIPFSENSGQINEIGSWVMQQAVIDMQKWEQLGFTGEIAINISIRQFIDQDLPAIYAQLKSQLPPSIPTSRLKLEVTESMSMANPQRASDILGELTAMGYKISIDDFGTGYSSLAYLHRFPFHTLKVDQSFVRRLDTGMEITEIIRTIATLGNTLNKQVLAEGIENEEHAVLLEKLGVAVGQGWLFAKALSYQDATNFIINYPHK